MSGKIKLTDDLNFIQLKQIFKYYLRKESSVAVFKMFRKSPPTGERVRIVPGFLGEYVAWHQIEVGKPEGFAVVRVGMQSFEKFINKHESISR